MELIPVFLKCPLAAQIVVADNSEYQIGFFDRESKIRQHGNRSGAVALAPILLFANGQVDAPAVLCGVFLENALQIHFLQPAFTDDFTIRFHDKTESAPRSGLENTVLDPIEVMPFGSWTIRIVQHLGIVAPFVNQAPIRFSDRPQSQLVVAKNDIMPA